MTAVQPIEQVKYVFLADLRVADWNARKTFDAKGIEELASSIREHGVQVPLLVRELPDSAWKSTEDHYAVEAGAKLFEIVAGHRRFEAAKLISMAVLPCIVRDLDDDYAREIGLVDNLQREDVPALEEADAYNELKQRMGAVATVASRVGKEVQYVAKRLQLVSLAEQPRKALAERLITIDHALLLARLGAAEQDQNLKWCLDTNAGIKTHVEDVIKQAIKRRDRKATDGWSRYFEPESVLELKKHIEQHAGRKLARAPWKLDDANLFKAAGPCEGCSSNTKSNTALFSDLAIEDATCASGGCFEAKTAAFVQLRLVDAGANPVAKPPVRVPRLSWKRTSVKPATCFNDIAATGAMTSTADPSKVLKAGQWVEAKKGSCPNVRPGVTVDWSDDADRGYMGYGKKLRKPGEILSVCIAVGCKAHRKEYEKPKSESSNGAYQRPDPAAEKKREEEQKHVGDAERAIRSKIFRAVLAKLDAARAIHMVADNDDSAPRWRKQLLEMLPKLSGEQLEAFTAFACTFDPTLCVNAYYMTEDASGVTSDRKDLWALAKTVGVNADAIAAKHFHDIYADSSSRASLAPWSNRLYPKDVKWPMLGAGPKKAASKPAVKKAAKSNPKKAAKKGGKK